MGAVPAHSLKLPAPYMVALLFLCVADLRGGQDQRLCASSHVLQAAQLGVNLDICTPETACLNLCFFMTDFPPAWEDCALMHFFFIPVGGCKDKSNARDGGGRGREVNALLVSGTVRFSSCKSGQF